MKNKLIEIQIPSLSVRIIDLNLFRSFISGLGTTRILRGKMFFRYFLIFLFIISNLLQNFSKAAMSEEPSDKIFSRQQQLAVEAAIVAEEPTLTSSSLGSASIIKPTDALSSPSATVFSSHQQASLDLSGAVPIK